MLEEPATETRELSSEGDTKLVKEREKGGGQREGKLEGKKDRERKMKVKRSSWVRSGALTAWTQEWSVEGQCSCGGSQFPDKKKGAHEKEMVRSETHCHKKIISRSRVKTNILEESRRGFRNGKGGDKEGRRVTSQTLDLPIITTMP